MEHLSSGEDVSVALFTTRWYGIAERPFVRLRNPVKHDCVRYSLPAARLTSITWYWSVSRTLRYLLRYVTNSTRTCKCSSCVPRVASLSQPCSSVFYRYNCCRSMLFAPARTNVTCCVSVVLVQIWKCQEPYSSSLLVQLSESWNWHKFERLYACLLYTSRCV